MEAIVNSQFPEAATMEGGMSEAIAKYSSMIDPQIWTAVLFALLGFFLVSGIEIAGKLIHSSKQS